MLGSEVASERLAAGQRWWQCHIKPPCRGTSGLIFTLGSPCQSGLIAHDFSRVIFFWLSSEEVGFFPSTFKEKFEQRTQVSWNLVPYLMAIHRAGSQQLSALSCWTKHLKSCVDDPAITFLILLVMISLELWKDGSFPFTPTQIKQNKWTKSTQY